MKYGLAAVFSLQLCVLCKLGILAEPKNAKVVMHFLATPSKIETNFKSVFLRCKVIFDFTSENIN